MSRHKDLKNLDLNDYEDEFEAEEELTEDQEEAYREAIEQVQTALEGTNIPFQEIKDTVWYYYFDVNKSVNYLLSKAIKAKEKDAKKTPVAQSQTKENSTKDVTAAVKKVTISQPSNALRKKQVIPQTTKTESEHAQIPQKKEPKLLDIPSLYEKEHEKPSIHLVVSGHVDSGKSTMIGRLLYEVGMVDERSMQKLKQSAANAGKGSFSYAWLLDSTDEERARGVTMDVADTTFESSKHIYQIGDAPGHKDFISGMIAGAYLSDYAILVVDASPNNFERGFFSNGQTREHAYLLRALSVKGIAVCVNKLDTVDWSYERFIAIKENILDFLVSKVGFKETMVHIVPVSGLSGENLIKRDEPKLLSWYNGPTLMNILDDFVPPTKPVKASLRITVNDTYRSAKGVCVQGRVESGNVQNNQVLFNVSTNSDAYVKSIIRNGHPHDWSVAGDNITMQLTDIDANEIRPGDILTTTSQPVKKTKSFIAEIQTFDLLRPILSGATLVLHRGRLSAPVVIKLQSVNGKKVRHITSRKTAIVKFTFLDGSYPICTVDDCKTLGKIILRREGDTVAAGVIRKV
ncbi:elongation factor 1 alpha like protein [Schizosaccharomyces japonicus yFS275]|uniref:Elongation factor 1 alpha-like protein n=1 Tax=Schizosaccharomyces japonicus (strain yFS275 / FY16936) TaxID=402676 RepID=B6K0P3_SCHJY|nr:elongation factor 1 alpha like protein [Schizosaccharomyces japonicus yFS275]EEB07514.2 elongation factor 1 alpha like protein [Schizosaccharomyces japonicus yFS275]